MSNIIGTDISHYESPVNFIKMKSAGAKFVIIKVGQLDFVDYDFHTLWFNAKGILPRGGYWFYDKRNAPRVQAELWIDSMQGDFGELPLFADFEGVFYGGDDIANFKIFLERVKELVHKEIIIYTGYYFWKDDSGYNSSYADYFKQYDLWIAAYGTTTPRIPLPWTEWTFHQYNDKGSGVVWGTGGGSVDLNYFNGDEAEFYKRFNIIVPSPEPDPDVLLSERVYFDGAVERKIEMDTTHGKTIYNLTVIETAKVEKFFVTPQKSDRDYVPEMLENYGLDFCINLDAWVSPPLTPAGYNASEGKPYGPTNQTETVWVSKENVFSFTRPSVLWNALSVQNRLVIEGVIPYIDKSLYDIRARTAIGWTQDQTKVFLLTVDGGDHWSNDGLNFHDTAKILLKLGCYYAFMHDGGASTAKAVNDNGVAKVIGETCGADSIATIPGYKYDKPLERVVNGLGVKMKLGAIVIPPETGENMHRVLVAVKPRIDHSMYANSATVNLAVGTEFEISGTFTVNDTSRVDNGVTFVQIVGGKYNQYWVPLVYKGVEYVKFIGVVDPPQTNEFVSATLTRKDGTTVEFIPKV